MAELPKLPKGKEFEEYISAFFQCGGFYVERNIIERDEKKEVLELDIVATSYEEEKAKSFIIEAKSGDWGFSDIFKIKGWLNYLRYTDGLFITNSPKKDSKFYENKANDIGIKLKQILRLSEAAEILKETIPGCEIIEEDFDTWRFSYWVERNLLRQLKKNKQFLYPGGKSYQKLDEYYFLLNSGIFFEENIVRRLYELYKTFNMFPRISAKCANELIGKSFDEDVEKLPKEIYESTYYKCDYNIIQISSFIEHRARLAILKNTIDYILGRRNREEKKNDAFGKNFEKDLLSLLPTSFKKGMEQIESHKYFYRYPIYWQWFMWFFGGFILKDYENEEYMILSKKTGIPIDEIPNAMSSYQLLFPQDDGWFIDLNPQVSNIKMIKMFPISFSGVGANFRRIIYADSKKYKKLSLSGENTLRDLIKWNNLTVKVLEEKFKDNR